MSNCLDPNPLPNCPILDALEVWAPDLSVIPIYHEPIVQTVGGYHCSTRLSNASFTRCLAFRERIERERGDSGCTARSLGHGRRLLKCYTEEECDLYKELCFAGGATYGGIVAGVVAASSTVVGLPVGAAGAVLLGALSYVCILTGFKCKQLARLPECIVSISPTPFQGPRELSTSCIRECCDPTGTRPLIHMTIGCQFVDSYLDICPFIIEYEDCNQRCNGMGCTPADSCYLNDRPCYPGHRRLCE
jgi:hypothetical protein